MSLIYILTIFDFLLIALYLKYGKFDLFFTKLFFKIYQELYYNNITKKGKVLTEENLKKIKKDKYNLYKCIKYGYCHGSCYSVCFDLLKTLKEGELYIVAIEKLFKEDDDNEQRTVHVLYVLDDYAFDTNFQLQMRVVEILKVYNVPEELIFCKLRYEDISNLTYTDFIIKYHNKLHNWSNKNNVECLL